MSRSIFVLGVIGLLAVCITTTNLLAQDTASPPTDDANSEQTADTPAEVAEELPPQLLTLEAIQRLVEANPNEQFLQLPRVSPRGADSATRQKMVALLMPLLQSEHPDIRARTAAAISLFGPESKSAIPALLKLLGDTEIDVYRKAVWSTASQALAKIGTATIQPAFDMLPDADETEFLGIVAVISELGTSEQSRATAPYFLDHLKNGPRHHRWATMYCLSKMGEHAKPAIPDYIQNLDDPNFNIQVIACRALAELGADSQAAIPKLVKLMEKDGNVLSTRTHAAMCLGAIGPVDPDVDLVALFESMISEPNAFCQERGLIALGRLGTHAAASAPFVEKLLENEDFSQRPEAALALWKVSGEAAKSIEILRPLITDLTYDFRALEALRTMGPAAAPMSDDVAALLETTDASMQLKATQVLAAMGTAKQYLDRLRSIPDQAPPEIAVELDAILAKLAQEP